MLAQDLPVTDCSIIDITIIFVLNCSQIYAFIFDLVFLYAKILT